MLLDGVNVMVVGMIAVFAFLALLVIVLQISARVFDLFDLRWPDPAIAATRSGAMLSDPGEVQIAVVLAAIEAHRRAVGPCRPVALP